MTTHLHLVPRSRMRGAIPPLPQFVFMAWCLVKHRDNFTFTLTSYAVLFTCGCWCFEWCEVLFPDGSDLCYELKRLPAQTLFCFRHAKSDPDA
jgi:hypothetical protein